MSQSSCHMFDIISVVQTDSATPTVKESDR
jgi:hypothetical protein